MSGASPGESPYLNRITWASYKALSRGQLGGLVLGGLVGLGVGIAAAAVSSVALPALGLPALTGGGLTALAAGFGAIGAKYYYDVFKYVGAASGAVAAGMEIGEERNQVMNIKLDTILNVLAKDGKISPGEIKAIEDDVEDVYRKGTHNFEKKFIDKPRYYWQVGIVGALAGLALFAAIGGAGYIATLFTDHAVDIGDFFVKHSSALFAGGAGMALAGASYGINRNNYRNVLNITNALYEGNLAEVEKQRARQYGLEPEQELPDFTSVHKGEGKQHAQDAASVPGNTVSAEQVEHTPPRHMVLADAKSWQELQHMRAEDAASQEQPFRLH